MRHTGWYLGNGMVVDARGTSSGVLHTSINNYPWTHWALPKGMLSESELAVLKGKEHEPEGGDSMIGKARVTGTRLALRPAMSTNNKELTRMETGTIIDILEKPSNTWWKVKHQNLTGYVMAKYVVQIDVPPTNPTAPDNADGGNDEVENPYTVHIPCKTRQEADLVLRLLKSAIMN